MSTPDPAVVLGPALSAALEKKGFTQLTAVQLAVLDPDIEGRDLRITSQTGSGKTVAIGFTLRNLFGTEGNKSKPGIAAPRALVVTPTRELAKQVEAELSWLFEPLGVRTASVIGGASYRDERRALAQSPGVVVGTPGRLVDHLQRGSIDPSMVRAVVLDEADRMLDMGFREELEAILARTPPDRLTHLASATFPREVRALADRVQKNPAHLEGTRLGVANVDIDHVIHLVDPNERLDAIVNLLCAAPEARSLIFARTRLDVTHIATELDVAGFAVGTLSGDMEQRERSRALAAFKRGQLRALVATDVAARGIDVPEVSDVIHVEAPNDADAYTHRSGRTGRAGRKGRSAILVALRELPQATRILKRAGVPHRFEPIPTAHEIRSSIDDRIVNALTSEEPDDLEGQDDARLEALAERISTAGNVQRALKRLLMRVGPAQAVEPRDVRKIAPPSPSSRTMLEGRAARGDRPRSRVTGRAHAEAPAVMRTETRETAPARAAAPSKHVIPNVEGAAPTPMARKSQPRARPAAGEASPPTIPPVPAGGWVPFHVTWGDVHGADPRRLLALVCRRGGIRGSDVGAIRVGRTSSVVEVAGHLAASFAQATRDRDPRDPRVQIREEHAAPASYRPPPLPEGPKTRARPHAGAAAKPAGKPPKRMRAR